ncbi:S8 family peptidase [Hyphobacterium sp.]|uniref:S8 family peptidase n=1 Tax=Hyphobacterium sp. TaxID=2004662 RepID=UPI003B517F9F
MDSFRCVFAGAILAIGLSSLSMAQTSIESLPEVSPDLQTALAERDRARVIVEFDFPQIAEDAPDDFDSERRFARMDASRDAAIQQALGISADVLASAPVAVDRPSISHEYRYTPAAAMYLDADEIAALLRSPNVRRVELDRVSRPLLDTSVGLVGAADLHTAGLTGEGASVAILDTGVDHQHPMVSGRIIESACFSTPDPAQRITGFCPNGLASDTVSAQAGDNCEEYADDPQSGAHGCHHGTHVGGIAAGEDFVVPNSGGQSLRGVAPGAGIVAVQVFIRISDPSVCTGSESPSCVRTLTSDQLAALEWLYANREALNLASINMSLGGGQFRSACDESVLTPIIRQLRTAGIATVIASGNESYPDTVGSPACITPAVTVGSSTDSDTLSNFSNTGYLIDLLAPGSAILSAYPSANDSGAGRAFETQGTSMATPHVAGAFALLRAAHPDASVEAIENALESTGRNIAHPRSGLQAPRIRIDLAHAELSSYGTGRVGALEITPLQAFDSLVSTRDPVTAFGTAHTLRNTGSSPISWSVRSDAPWIRFAEQSISNTEITDNTVAVLYGTVQPGESQRIFVFANGTGMAPGSYQSHYEIAPQAANSRVLIAARLSIAAPPTNDNFGDASPLASVMGKFSINTLGATRESGEPQNSEPEAGGSVWYRWTAPFSGQMSFSAASSTMTPIVSVYTGDDVAALSPVQTTIARRGSTNTVFDAVAGTTYKISVAGADGLSGLANAIFAPSGPPGNYPFANALAISGRSGRVSNFIANIGNVALSADNASNAEDPFAWYEWTAPANGTVWFDPTFSTFPAGIGAISDGTEIAEALNGRISFAATAGETYQIAVFSPNQTEGLYDLAWSMDTAPDHLLAAALLPTVRTGRIGTPTTAFATLVNPARFGREAENCRILPPLGFAGEFTYQRTDPATNQTVGEPNTPINIPGGGSQTFVIGLIPATSVSTQLAAIDPAVVYGTTPLEFGFACDNTGTAPVQTDVNTLRLNADAYPDLDIVARTSTLSGDGIVNVPQNGVTRFSVSALNIGPIPGAVAVVVRPSRELPLQAEICPSDPMTGACAGARGNIIGAPFVPGSPQTFTVIVGAGETPVDFSPRTNRLSLIFLDANEKIVGGTSVAVRTVANP